MSILSIAKPQSCQELLLTGTTQSGEYKIWIDGTIPKIVYCNMKIDGGGWIVIQRRIDNSTDFYRGWNEYKYGFGNVTHNFWLGLDSIHSLTRMGAELRADVADIFGRRGFANYPNFMIGDESSNYTLHISGYSGNASDGLSYYNGAMFGTKDRGDDISDGSCAIWIKTVWSFQNCSRSYLNGILWYTGLYTVNYSEMKVRLQGK